MPTRNSSCQPLADGGCEATLTLWVTLPDGLSDEVVAAAADGQP